jgi:hypothetical protein
MVSIGIQAHPHQDFLILPLKTSLKGWHMQWFYCKNHELSLSPFVGRLPENDKTWIEEPLDAKMLVVKSLANRISESKQVGLTIVGVVTNYLAHQVIPLKK